MEISASVTAVNGIQKGFERLNTNTEQLTKMPASNNDVSKNLIDNKMTQTDIEALVKVLKTEDQLIGQLLDMKA